MTPAAAATKMAYRDLEAVAGALYCDVRIDDPNVNGLPFAKAARTTRTKYLRHARAAVEAYLSLSRPQAVTLTPMALKAFYQSFVGHHDDDGDEFAEAFAKQFPSLTTPPATEEDA